MTVAPNGISPVFQTRNFSMVIMIESRVIRESTLAWMLLESCSKLLCKQSGKRNFGHMVLGKVHGEFCRRSIYIHLDSEASFFYNCSK